MPAVRRVKRCSAAPSPSPSRSSTILSGEGPPAPTRPMNSFMKKVVTPLPPSRGGELVSATSTSPFGSVSKVRGWSSFSAKRLTARPLAGAGASPGPQPMGLARPTLGKNSVSASTSSGFLPVVAEVASSDGLPRSTQAMRAASKIRTMPSRMRILRRRWVMADR